MCNSVSWLRQVREAERKSFLASLGPKTLPIVYSGERKLKI